MWCISKLITNIKQIISEHKCFFKKKGKKVKKSEKYFKKGKKNKFNAKKTQLDGFVFDSQMESRRYIELKILEKVGKIKNLEMQKRYILEVQGQKIGSYLADFVYEKVPEGEVVIEDVKGFRTALYRWKKKHVEAQYGIPVTETKA